MSHSHLVEKMLSQLADRGIEKPVPEYKFHNVRRWRFDLAWPHLMLAAEAEGGTWSKGRHTRGSGYSADCEKYNVAAIEGWTVLRFTPDMIRAGTFIEHITAALDKAKRTTAFLVELLESKGVIENANTRNPTME